MSTEPLPPELARDGEAVAGRYLAERGLRILGCNYATPLGEIDVVALDGETLVFVEVKTRASAAGATPEEAVTASKRRKLTQLALAFMKQHGQMNRRCRFDVVAVTWPEAADTPHITHYPHAFPAAAGYEAY